MGVTRHQTVQCSCRNVFVVHLADSVNATRSPEVRQRILDGQFHRFRCPACSRLLTVERPFHYTDLKSGSIIRVHPPQDAHRWKEASDEVNNDAACLPEKIASEKRLVRVVFGLGELREKLIAQDAGIDDRVIELMKALVLYEHPFLMRKPRLRVFLDRVSEASLDSIASHDHSSQAFRISIPRTVLTDLETNETAENWADQSHDTNIFKLRDDRWVSFRRWSPQTPALQLLKDFATEVRQGRTVEPDSADFKRMLRDLPRGTSLPSWAKAELRTLQRHFSARRMGSIEEQLFEIRFDFEMESEWATNQNLTDIDTLWDLLKNLPDTNVEGNSFIRELLLDEGGRWRLVPTRYERHRNWRS